MNTPITHNEYIAVEEFAKDLKHGIEQTITDDTILDRHSKTMLRFVENMLGVYKKRFELFSEEMARANNEL
jgi:hypothetical protein